MSVIGMLRQQSTARWYIPVPVNCQFATTRPVARAYDGIRTICTEQWAWRATASETLPRKKRPNPLRP